MLNYNLIYNPIFITCFFITFILLLLLIYFFYYNYTQTLNFEIQNIQPKTPKVITYYNHSLIDKYPVNNNKFPEFKNATSYKVELNPGDSLFIPAGWWHWVFSEDNCIAFSHIIHNFDEDAITEKQSHNYKKKTIKYYNYNNRNSIDFIKHSTDSMPLAYNNPTINKLTNFFLEQTLDKANIMVSKTNTIHSVNKSGNTTMLIINGKYEYFNILNNSPNYYCYIGMMPLDKEKFKYFINNDWNIFANTNNNKNDIYLWHSKKNIDTGLHYDITDNLLTLHSGKKTIMLFPPSEKKYLYNKLLNNINNFGRFIQH